MIIGTHFLMYAHDADKARAFFRERLGLSSVDAGHGWLIFALPPSEMGIHPADGGEPSDDRQPQGAIYLLCDNLQQTVDELRRKGVDFSAPISDQPWGRLIMLNVPGAGQIGLYQPKHPLAISPTPAATH